MNETVFMEVREPNADANLRFSTRKKLCDHVKKHVFNEPNEKWENLFSTNKIKAALESYDNPARREIYIKYEEMLACAAMKCCVKGQSHIHFQEQMTLETQSLRLSETREPAQVIKCWDKTQNLVIILSATVINGEFSPYVIKTGYRTYPNLKQNRWLNHSLMREEERSSVRDGREQIRIAEHID